MKPAPFAYARVDTLDEALELLERYGEEARVLAGGQSLAPMLNMRLVQPEVLIDIGALCDLDTIERVDGYVRVGATVTQQRMASWARTEPSLPLLNEVFPYIGHVQTQSQGTVCGSVAHADPSAELPLSLVLLDGVVELASSRGVRSVAARDYIQGALTTDCHPDEMVIAVRFEDHQDKCVAFDEVAHRHGDFALLAVAVITDGRSVRVGFGGLDEGPVLLECETRDVGEIVDALDTFARTADVSESSFAGTSYRRELIRRLGQRTIEKTLR